MTLVDFQPGEMKRTKFESLVFYTKETHFATTPTPRDFICQLVFLEGREIAPSSIKKIRLRDIFGQRHV